MSEGPKKRGPKPKPPEELSERMLFTLPRELARDAKKWLPRGVRSEIVQRCLANAVEEAKERERLTAPPAERQGEE